MMVMAMASLTSNPYKHADKVLATLRKQVDSLFHNMVNRIRFDELNVIRAQSDTDELYQKLEALNENAFDDVARKAYAEAEQEAVEAGYDVEEGADKAHSIVTMIMASFNSITRYVYNNEVERKRSRAFEALVAATSRLILRDGAIRAARLWFDMSRQYVDMTVDAARTQAFIDSGVEQVRWVTMKDGKVCAACHERDGEIYDIHHLPDKHHRCRCHYIPVRKD